MTRQQFCEQLRERLLSEPDKVLLRVAMAPQFETPLEFTGKLLLERAQSLAASVLSSLPAAPQRAVVLVLLPHSPELFLLQLGLVLRGCIPAILAWPTTRVDAEKYQRNLIHQVSQLPADALVTLPRLAQNLANTIPYPLAGLDVQNSSAFEKLFPTHAVSTHLENKTFPKRTARLDDGVMFLQFSGGTTGAQKAVVVTAEMLHKQFAQLSGALQITSEDSVVSWLPMYHDMGLIACFWLPLWQSVPSLQMAASDWVINPELLFRYVQQYRGSLCWLPNFGFSYLSQRREFMQRAYELSSMRAWINCSEPVRQKSVSQFVQSFADWGVRSETVSASYAMAETVFAITQSEPGKSLQTVLRSEVKRGAHGYADLAFDLIDEVYVSSGKPFAETSVRVTGEDGSICTDDQAGEIHVRTPSLFSGYWGAEGFQRHTLNDGWHATGDYGFLRQGELFVIGRFKDIIIVGGNNIFPEDVEALVNTIDGVYPGRVVAFGVEDQEYGTQSLAVIAETKDAYDEAAAEIEASIRKLVLTTIGTAPRHVAIVPQRWIVKSTAGKISRRETREKFLRERVVTA
jgi:fatty-acyl-CoA synthase